MTDQELFARACERVLNGGREPDGIGTLGEKTVHAVLKQYLEPRRECQEVRVGRYVADICSERGIMEIQTRNFNALRDKLAAFLENGPVTVVYPIPHIKWLRWIDEETGEISKRRKSPKKGTPYMVLSELYKIKSLLTHKNLRLRLILLNLEEYRLLNGWSGDRKKGSSRFDRIPLELVRELEIACAGDYKKLIPPKLADGFTAKEYAAAAGLTPSKGTTALNVLFHVGAVARCGKKGRAYCYKAAGKAEETIE